MALKFIGVSGHFGAGKDTVASMLVEMLRGRGKPAQRFAFADALKALCTKYFDWDGIKSLGVQSKHYDESKADVVYARTVGGRQLLQGLGVLMREEVQANFWVQRLELSAMRWARDIEAPVKYAIISDVRFLNETELCDLLLCVERPKYTGDAHLSETIMDTPEFRAHVTTVLPNAGTLDALRDRVGAFVTELLGE